MFVGYPRTGHSLIGSLLDAHPRIVIAHELDALRLFQSGFQRRQVFHLLLENSRKMAAAGRSHSGYSYAVPDQWQGRFETLQVLGDKKGATSAMRFYREPGLLTAASRKIATEIRFVHVIRNPFDVLATMARRSPRKTLQAQIDLFFTLCASVGQLKQRVPPAQLHDIRLEDFVRDPKTHLAELCAFLGVAAERRYLDDCAGIVFRSAKKSRFDIDWSAGAIAEVRARMEPFGFLSGYSFDDADELRRPVAARTPPPH
jgi:hypothetical protein